MSAVLHYYYPWTHYPNEVMPMLLREFLDHGISNFVFTDQIAWNCIQDAEYAAFFRKEVKEFGVHFGAMHGLCGAIGDLDITDSEKRDHILKHHIQAMTLEAEFGGLTYTVHPGAAEYCRNRIPVSRLIELSIEMLEKMVPVAEKLGIVIAVENSFEPPNTPEVVLNVIRPFLGNPAIGVCYDTGHANMMAPADWKKAENYPDYQKQNWAETGLIKVPDAIEQLQPYIVTTHIHDNDGYRDLHGMPFDGTIEWDELMPKIRNCPLMLEYQTEVCMESGINWAGHLLAPHGGYSVKRLVDTFHKLGF